MRDIKLKSLAAIVLTLGALGACGGGGGDAPAFTAPPAPPPPPPPPPTTAGSVTISGNVTFDRVPIDPVTIGLDYDNIRQDPVRSVPVEARDASGTVLASTMTDATGAYSLDVAPNTSVSINATARLLQTTGATFDVQVLDNTSSNAPYVLTGSLTSSGAADSTRNLNAASGWDGTQYSSTRAAGPFAILDSIFEAVSGFIEVDNDVVLPPLMVFWSVNNTPSNGNFADGAIGTSFFSRNNANQPFLAILGAANNDTDEYDTHVVVHEFGHYFEDVLSRSDSIGGSHNDAEALDLRVALSEGFANALSGMLLGDPVYRDTSGPSQGGGFIIDNEANTVSPEGWFNEGSVQSILFDIFDDVADGPDNIAVGFGPIYRAFVSDAYTQTPELTSIFAITEALIAQPEIDAAAIAPLLTAQSITSTQSDASGETNNGGIATALPVYKAITLGGPECRSSEQSRHI